jgi:hypothetical protein
VLRLFSNQALHNRQAKPFIGLPMLLGGVIGAALKDLSPLPGHGGSTKVEHVTSTDTEHVTSTHTHVTSTHTNVMHVTSTRSTLELVTSTLLRTETRMVHHQVTNVASTHHVTKSVTMTASTTQTLLVRKTSIITKTIVEFHDVYNPPITNLPGGRGPWWERR